MKQDELARPTHLFTVRVWLAKLDHGHTEWRGKVQHVLSGEGRAFRDWPALVAFLVAKLQEIKDDEETV
jgi:hypothetical protein